jgi:hypothetical protein
MHQYQAYLIAFLMGATLISFLDWYHCKIGVMSYIVQIEGWMIVKQNWPVWITLQMGIAGVVMIYLWKKIRKFLMSQFFSK